MKRENPFDKIPEDRTAVDNILRINVNNQVRLTVMADQKANIMITVASQLKVASDFRLLCMHHILNA